MKKVIAVLILIGLIIIIFFAFRSCDVAKKTDEEATDTGLTEETINLSAYREAFVSANTEFTCQVINDSTLSQDETIMRQLLDEAYRKYGFPVEDNALMIDILNLYETDQGVIDEIKANVNECKTT